MDCKNETMILIVFFFVCSIVGAAIIVGCVTLITLRKWVRTLPEKHSRRQAFWFVLR